MPEQPSLNDVWIVSRELKGLAGVGGVGVVTRELALALARAAFRTTIVIPCYSQIDLADQQVVDTGITFVVPMDYADRRRDRRITVWRMTLDRCTVYLIDAPCFREKEGIYTYTEDEAIAARRQPGACYFDFFEMNVTLQKAALSLMQCLGAHPDVVHCQDAHTALIPVMMRRVPRYRDYFADVACGITIHNAGGGYQQEVHDIPFAAAITELDGRTLRPLLHRGALFPFVAGGVYAGFLNAVSENYAREMLESETEDRRAEFLGTACRERGIQLTGVTNGIEPGEYDPTAATRLGIAAGFDPRQGDLAGKRLCRQALLDELNHGEIPNIKVTGSLSPDSTSCLIGMVSRLASQKGIEPFVDAARSILDNRSDAMFVVLGQGQSALEDRIAQLATTPQFQGRCAFARGHDDRLATRVYAGIDLFVNSAEFEPCGLTDYIAALMGAVPVVHHVGGLVKVRDGVTGYGYKEHSSRALADTLERAVTTFHESPAVHKQLLCNAVNHIHAHGTWDRVLEKGYRPLYDRASCFARQMITAH